MNILKDLSKKDLKLNKKRSAVIIIGIILSTALICGVAGIVTSFQNTFIKYAKEKDGNYHVQFCNVPKEELKYIEENRNIKDYYLSESLGYSYLEDSQNENKPYVYLMSMDEKSLNNMGLNLIDGRLPENSNEIVISNHIITNARKNYKVGDSITLEIGKRQLKDGTELTQENPYQEGEEEIIDTNKKTYKIVGIIERLSTKGEPHSAPGYTVITKLEEIQNKANIAVLYTKKYNYQKYTEQINDMKKAEKEDYPDAKFIAGMRDETYKSYKYEINVNTSLLAYEGVNLSDATMEMIYILGAIIMVIILVSSVFVIRNGFAISITERLKQYGMLSSIGATKKQIKKSVYFEGFILGIIGIPLGILSGIFAIFILLKVVNFILKDYIAGTELIYSISWQAIILSIFIAIITIWLSCRSSARKASKVTPIEAIRSSDDVKLKAKKVKCPKVITKVFKTGGEIAYKNLKRSKKKYRTTVISIIVSVVTFISISSFIQYGFEMSGSYYTEIGYNIRVSETGSENQKEKYKRLQDISKIEGIDEFSIHRRKYIELYNKDDLSDFGKKINAYDDVLEVIIISVGNEEYQRFIKDVGGKYEDYENKAILIDDCISYDEDANKIKGNLYNWRKGDIVKGKTLDGKDSLSIQIAKRTDKKPMGLESLNSCDAYLVISDEYMDNLGDFSLDSLLINTKNSTEVEEKINQFYKDLNLQNDDSIYIHNVDEEVKANNAIVLVISIFLYGFITVITLIGVTNIFNTITTNMNLRKKEFAMLKSIGMTKKEFDRMIRLESIFYGSGALIIGLPIGICLSYLIYKAFETSMGMTYVLPYKAIGISIVFVILVVGIIMRYSMSKINKQNIIETIRNDNI